MPLAACSPASEFAGMGWPGAFAAVGISISVSVAFMVWAISKYL